MNWINMLGPWQWLLLASIPPAILSLYFLKLKRRECAVPSTMLWRKAIEDLHVNSIWQKLRQNLLLYLQLLFVALLMLACIRPGWSGMNRAGERRIYIIDHSASMQATDETPSRLELAKAHATKLIQDAASDDVAMVIATSDRASVEQGFTNNKSLLLNGVDRIAPTAHTTDIREALRVAAGLANPGRASFEDSVDVQVADAIPATVYILSDGAVGQLDDTELGQLKIEYVPIGQPETQNVAILGFALQRPQNSSESSDKIEAFARIVLHESISPNSTSTNSTPIETTASLYWNDELLDAQKIKLDPGREIGLQFEVDRVDSGSLKLQIDHPDPLPLDNVAFAAIRPNRQVNVLLITNGNTALERALQTSRIAQMAQVSIETKSFLDSQDYASAAADSKYDLIVFDRCAPKKMPEANTLFFGSVPPAVPSSDASNNASNNAVSNTSNDTSGTTATDTVTANTNADSSTDTIPNTDPNTDSSTDPNTNSAWIFGEPTGPVIIVDVNRSHPISQYLEMASVGIVESRTVKPPAGGTVLMIADIGPVCSVAPRGAYQDAVLGFDLVRPTEEGTEINSDWGIKRSFPIFIYSAVEQLAGGITEASAPTVQPGWPIHLTLSNRFANYEIKNPSGNTTNIERGSDGRFLFTQTEEIGVYEVYAQGIAEPVERFCVNLFSSRESNLQVGLELNTGAESISATDTTIRARQETWRWWLLLALGLLTLEWIVFNRRAFV
jgi:hypothetical protein